MPDEPVVHLAVRMPWSLRQQVKVACVEDNVTMGDVVQALLKLWLRKRDEQLLEEWMEEGEVELWLQEDMKVT